MSDYYQISQLRDNVFRITSQENVYCELLIGTEKAMLIDTGFGYGDFAGFVRKQIDKPLVIVNTHGHLDHANGNAQFNESVYLSPADFELCKTHTSSVMREGAAKNAAEAGYLPDGFDQSAYVARGTGNLVPLNDGDIFDLGGMTIRAIATPGHTHGSMCFLYQEANWLYVGDQTNPHCWLFLKESTDKTTHLASLDKLIALAPDKIIGSHMPEPVGIEELHLYRRAAAEAEFEKGMPFEFGNIPPDETRMFVLDGMTEEDSDKPGYASVVINKSWK